MIDDWSRLTVVSTKESSVDDRPGYFTCSICDASFADVFEKSHLESHGIGPQEGEPSPSAERSGIFWAWCVAIGTLAALILVVVRAV